MKTAESEEKIAPMWADRPGDWWVLHVKSRQEKALQADLKRTGVDTYLPLLETARTYGHRKEFVHLPFFAGYLFMKGERQAVFDADRSKRLVQPIQVHPEACEGFARSLAHIDRTLTSGEEVKQIHKLEPGVRVEVLSGVCEGLIGVVDRIDNPQKIQIIVDFIQKGSEMQLRPCELRRLDD